MEEEGKEKQWTGAAIKLKEMRVYGKVEGIMLKRKEQPVESKREQRRKVRKGEHFGSRKE